MSNRTPNMTEGDNHRATRSISNVIVNDCQKSIRVEQWIMAMNNAEKSGLWSKRRFCASKIARNFINVMKHATFLTLSANNLLNILQMNTIQVASEKELFDSLLKWLMRNTKKVSAYSVSSIRSNNRNPQVLYLIVNR